MTPIVNIVPRLEAMARAKANSTTEKEDMIQDGAVGLLEAAGRYDSSRGCSFTTYGSRRAWGAMQDQLRSKARRWREAPGAEAWDDDYHPGRVEREDNFVSQVMVARFKRFLHRVLPLFEDRLRDVLTYRYYDGLSVRTAAAKLNTSPASIVRWEREAVTKLREAFIESGYGRDD